MPRWYSVFRVVCQLLPAEHDRGDFPPPRGVSLFENCFVAPPVSMPAELERPRLARAWSSGGLQSSRSLGNLGEETIVRRRPANSREERAAQADNERRKRENGRSLRTEHIALGGTLPPHVPPQFQEEFVLRWAGEPMARAIDAAFADSRTASSVRVGGTVFSPAPGDYVLSPVATFEIHDQSATECYVKQKAAAKRASASAPAAPALSCLTDGTFEEAIDPYGPAGYLGENEKILFHAAESSAVLEILYSGVFDRHTAAGGAKVRERDVEPSRRVLRWSYLALRPSFSLCLSPSQGALRYGPGMYFSDLVCTSDRYAGDVRDSRQVGSPGSVMAGHMRLTALETSRVRFMIVYRVQLGHAAITASRLVPPYDDCRSEPPEGESGPSPPIFAPKTHGKRFAPPFTSLIAAEPGEPSEVIVKQVARPSPPSLSFIARTRLARYPCTPSQGSYACLAAYHRWPRISCRISNRAACRLPSWRTSADRRCRSSWRAGSTAGGDSSGRAVQKAFISRALHSTCRQAARVSSLTRHARQYKR